MDYIIYLFPVLFIIHELEEIFGFEKWYKKRRNALNKYPKIAKKIHYVFSYYSNKGMLFAIIEQLVLLLIVCFLALKYDFYILWLAAFIGYTIHLIVHFFQSLALKMYIPSFITSIIEIPICFYIIYFVFNKYNFSLNEVFLYSVFAIIIIIFNLYLVHKVMKKYFNS